VSITVRRSRTWIKAFYRQGTMPTNRRIYWALGVLLLLSAAIRAFVAGFIELGNDEVYYWTYAKFPALSHFDHPPMVGLVIQFFTFNLKFDSEFFLRLGSVVFGTLSTGMMFLIGKKIKNPLTGLYAALLFSASFYGFILSGTFILPDSPQVFFWLLTVYCLLHSLAEHEVTPGARNWLFFAGIAAGFALLSKYHSLFLLGGAFMFMLMYNRRWFLVKETYGAFFVALLFTLPVVFWNIENDFISFTFHENRVGVSASGIQLQYFLTEVVGQIFYNNPVNVGIILFALVSMSRKGNFLDASYRRLILWLSLPLIVVFLIFSLFKSTLPHWTGPGYLGLILIAAAYLSEPGTRQSALRLIPFPVAISLAFILTIVVAGVGQIRYGWVPLQRWKMDDVSLDMYGWKQLGVKIAQVSAWDENHYMIDPGSPFLTFRWFPAANFDYYVARPLHRKVYAFGDLERIHKYFWINGERGRLKPGSDAYYIALSDDYEDPVSLYGNMYSMIIPSDTIYITRGSDTVRKAFVYRLIDLKQDVAGNPSDTVTTAVQPGRDTLQFFLIQIKSDPRWMDILQKKADLQGRTLDEMVRAEAMKLKEASKKMVKPADSTAEAAVR
jgi:hypothetical protein